MKAEKLRAQLLFLRRLQRLSAKKRKQALQNPNKEEVQCLCEIVANLLAGNIDINNAEKKKLKKHKKFLRQLTDNRRKVAGKRQLLIQSGGSFLLALLPAAISAITSLIR